MSTPYGISRNIGSSSFGGYVNAPIFGPLTTNQYPGAIPFHGHGTLVGQHPNPPLFYPSQEPVESNQFTNARHVYYRTANSKLDLAMKRERAIKTVGNAFYDYSTHKRQVVSTHMNYIKPMSSSSYIDRVKANAVGKSSYKAGLPLETAYSTKCVYPSGTRSSIRRVRSGGCVAPKKKGAIENTSLKNGQVCAWGAIPRQNY